MNGIDPKWGLWVSGVGFLLTFLSATSTAFPDYVPAFVADYIRQTAHFLSPLFEGVCFILFGGSSTKQGPFVPLMQGTTPKALVLIPACLAALLLASGGVGKVEAAPLVHKRMAFVHDHASQPVKALPNLQQLFQNMQTITIADLQTADLDAQAQGDRVADQCYVGILTVVSAQHGIDTTDLPKVHIFTTFQQFRDFVVALRVGSPLKTACAPLADEMKTDVTTLVTQITAGTFSWATVAPLLGL